MSNKVNPESLSVEDNVSGSRSIGHQSITVPKLFRSLTRESSYLSSDFAASTNGSLKAMNGSGAISDNLYLHPEVHDPHTLTNGSDLTRLGRSVSDRRRPALPGFGQVMMDFSPDEIVTDSVASSRLWQVFRPLLITMAIFGLYHPSKEDVKERDVPCNGSVLLRIILIVWAVLLGLFLSFVIVLICCYTDVSNGVTILTITELCVLLCLISALIQLVLFFTIFESIDRYEEMVQVWCVWLRWQNEQRGPYLSTWIIVISLTSIVYALVVSILVGLSIFGHLPSFGLNLVSFNSEMTFANYPCLHTGVSVCFSVAFAVATFISAMHVAFFASISRMVSYEFRMLAREIQVEVRGQAVIWDMKIEPLSAQEVTVMEYLRRKHSKLCNVVSTFDYSIRESLFFCYVLNLPVIIINMYVLLLSTSTENQVDFAGGTLILLTVSSATQILLIWWSAVQIHIWAHRPAEILQTVDIHEKREISHSHQTSLFLFLSTLTERRIALTLWGMLPLNRKFFLGILLIMVTYLIILTAHALRPIDVSQRNGSVILSTLSSLALPALSEGSQLVNIHEKANFGQTISPREVADLMVVNATALALSNSSKSFSL